MRQEIICHDISDREYAVSPDKFIFRPSVYGVLIEDGKILLSRQWDGYDFPGGGMNIDETLEEALLREFWEETGLRVRPLYVFFASSAFFKPKPRDGRERYWNCPIIYFLVERVSGELSKDNFDQYEKDYLDMAEWLKIADTEKLKFYNYLGSKSFSLIKRAVEMKKRDSAAFSLS